MKVMLNENVTHYIEVEMSDELDLDEVLKASNNIRNQCDSAEEAIGYILDAYRRKNNNAFDYHVRTNNAWDNPEDTIDFAYDIEE